MAKGNLFLGFARGKVGDTVFYRQHGEQCSRARNRHPSNPQSPLQLLQRVCMKTTSLAFSMLQAITNHSFQGRAEGTACQSRFTELNIGMMRHRLSAELASGDPAEILGSSSTNFSKKSSYMPEIMPYIVSEGTLPSIPAAIVGGIAAIQFELWFAPTGIADLTYQSIVDALSLSPGDQLTFLALSCDDRSGADIDGGVFNRFRYARVIMMPSDGDMTSPFLDEDGLVNKPNPRNEGDISFGYTAATKVLNFYFNGISDSPAMQYSLAACTVIASRLESGTWTRSPQSLEIRSSNVAVQGHLQYDHDVDTLADAIASFLASQQSSLYLNQATV